MQGDDPPFLPVGTDVSAKYKGAFCEAKIKKVVRNIKCKVTLKAGGGTITVNDDVIKGNLRVGSTVEVKQDPKKDAMEAVITKIQDCSQYTVVFDDGDITTLRRSALCLKSGRHFNESETLDQLPLTHPEHFSTPVIAGRRGRRGRAHSEESEGSGSGRRVKADVEPHVGRVVLVEAGGGAERRRPHQPAFPALVVAPTAQIKVKEDYLVRSFKDGRYYTVPKKEAREFRKGSAPLEWAGVEAALQYLNNGVLPPHWDRDALFNEPRNTSDDSSDDEPREEKDHFVAQLYKFMDERGTPLNRNPTIANKDIDLYRLFKVVEKLGGYNRVTNQNQWKTIADKMGFHPVTTSITNLCKQAYKKFLHSYEDFYRKLGVTLVAHPRGARTPPAGRSLIRDRDRHPPTSSSTSASASASACSTPTGTPTQQRGKEKDSADKSETDKSDKSEKDEKLEKAEKVKEKPRTSDGEDSADNQPLVNTVAPKAEKKEEKEKEEKKEKEKEKEDKKEAEKEKETEEKKEKEKEEKKEKEKEEKKEREKKEKEKEDKKEKEKEEKKEKEKEDKKEKEKEEKKEKEKEDKKEKEKQKDKEREKSSTSSSTSEEKTVVKPRSQSKGRTITPVKTDHEKRIPKRRPLSSKTSDGASTSTSRASRRPHASTDSDSSGRASRCGPIKKMQSRRSQSANSASSGNTIASNSSKRPRKRKNTEPSTNESTRSGVSNVKAQVGDKLKVYYGPTQSESKVTYEAKVIEISSEGMLRVHYTGWNTRYDEWIKPQRIALNVTQHEQRNKKNISISRRVRPRRTEESSARSDTDSDSESDEDVKRTPKKSEEKSSSKTPSRSKDVKSSDSSSSSKPRKRPVRTISTPTTVSPPKKPRPNVTGRDYDLNEIRSELKGLHSVKQEADETIKPEGSDKEPTLSSPPSQSNPPATDPPQPEKTAEDVYEFKEPEPFELELHDEKKKRTHRIFDDISPSKYSSTLSKSLSEEISEDPLRARPSLRSPSLSPFRDFGASRDLGLQSPEDDSKDGLFSLDDDSFPGDGSSGPTFEGFTPAKNQETYSKKSKVSKLRELIDDSPDSPADDEQSSDDEPEDIIIKEERDPTPVLPVVDEPKTPEPIIKDEPMESEQLLPVKEVVETVKELPKEKTPEPPKTPPPQNKPEIQVPKISITSSVAVSNIVTTATPTTPATPISTLARTPTPTPAPNPTSPPTAEAKKKEELPKTKPHELPKTKPLDIPKAKALDNPKTKPLDIPKTKPLEVVKTKPLDIPKTKPLDVPKTKPQDIPKTKPLDTPKTKPQDTPKTKALDTPKTKPLDTLKTKPQDTPKTKPQDTPKTKPQDTPKTKPQDTPKTKPLDTPKTKLLDTPKTKPVDSPKTKPQDTPKTKPLDTPKTKPQDTPKSKPMDLPKSKPPDLPKSKPVDNPKTKPLDNPKTKPQETPKTKPVELPKGKILEIPKTKLMDLPKEEPKKETKKEESKLLSISIPILESKENPLKIKIDKKMDPVPIMDPVASNIQPPSSPLIDTEEDKSEPDSPARIDVLPEPPPGFLLQSEGPKIAEKLLKAISSAKRLSMSPPPAEDRPATPKSDTLKLTKPDVKLSPLSPETKPVLKPELTKPQVKMEPIKKPSESTADSIFGDPPNFIDLKRDTLDVKKAKPDEPIVPRLQSPLNILERRKSVADLSLSVPGKNNKVLSDTIQKLSSQINQSAAAAAAASLPLPSFPTEDRSESSDSDDSDRRLIIDKLSVEEWGSGGSSEAVPAAVVGASAATRALHAGKSLGEWSGAESLLMLEDACKNERKHSASVVVAGSGRVAAVAAACVASGPAGAGEDDSNISLLLCEETIPGSPAPDAEPAPPRQRLHMPFASAPPHHHTHSKDDRRGEGGSRSTAAAGSGANPNEAAQGGGPSAAAPAPHARDAGWGRTRPLLDNTPPTTPDSSLDMSPHRERRISERDSPSERKEDEDDGRPNDAASHDVDKSHGGSRSRKASESSAGGALRGRGRRARRDTDDAALGAHAPLAPHAPHAPHAPLKYNFYVDLDPTWDCQTRINVLTSRLADLRKAYHSVKAELAAIDRRRKKLRRKEREAVKAAKAACS